jgi:CNT family concentrative nucleoside transporter
VILAALFALSGARRSILWKTVISGVLLQFLIALLVLRTSPGLWFFGGARDFVVALLDYSKVGSAFVFGGLMEQDRVGFSFATMVLPSVIVIGALMGILYHLGILQALVRGLAWVMVRLMGTSGAESLAAAANIFAGQTEAPLFIRPYLSRMTRSEILALMSAGMATVSGSLLGAYVLMGIDAGHLLAASVMSAPAALVCAKLLLPELETPTTRGKVQVEMKSEACNLIDAAATGATDGLKLALNVGAMLIAFIALIAVVNGIVGGLGGLAGFPQLSLEWAFGKAFAPVAWLTGVPWEDCGEVGILLGKRLVTNEVVAYLDMQKLLDAGALSERAKTLATYSLCGFANFSSIAIQVGGIGALAPERRGDLARLGLRGLLAGTAACLMTACVAGIVL